MEVKYGVAESAGTRYYGLNQDAWLACRVPVKDKQDVTSTVHAFGVFDGHYIGGDFASSGAAKSFEKHLLKRLSSPNIDDKTIGSIFKSVHQDLLALYDNPPASASYVAPAGNKLVKWTVRKAGQMQYYSYGGKFDRPIEFGTTAILVLLIESTGECIVAWAGDSRAILLSQDDVDDEFTVVTSLNDLHSAHNVKEKKRIESQYPATVNSDGYVQPKDPFYKNMQINMTRALGHRILQNYGVVADPQVKRFKISDKDLFLVIGSDGLWENLPDAEVRDLVVEHTNPKHGANSLIERILKYDPVDVDNVTAVVVSTHLLPPPRRVSKDKESSSSSRISKDATSSSSSAPISIATSQASSTTRDSKTVGSSPKKKSK